MHSKASLTLALGIMAVSAYAIVAAWAWPLKAALFPLAIAGPLFCLAAAEALWGIFGAAPAGEVRDFRLSTELPREEARRRTLVALAWILGFFAAIVLLGFPYAVPLLVFLYVKLQGRESWPLSIVLTLAVWAVFYGLFDRLLHLPFAAGWLFAFLR
jgi:hypothetical protein